MLSQSLAWCLLPCLHGSQARASHGSATTPLPLVGLVRLVRAGWAGRAGLLRSGWPGLGWPFHGHVYPVAALGGESGMFPEPAGGAVLQDVASDGQVAGIGLI